METGMEAGQVVDPKATLVTVSLLDDPYNNQALKVLAKWLDELESAQEIRVERHGHQVFLIRGTEEDDVVAQAEHRASKFYRLLRGSESASFKHAIVKEIENPDYEEGEYCDEPEYKEALVCGKCGEVTSFYLLQYEDVEYEVEEDCIDCDGDIEVQEQRIEAKDSIGFAPVLICGSCGTMQLPPPDRRLYYS